jgi:single-strand DNA-binding protein
MGPERPARVHDEHLDASGNEIFVTVNGTVGTDVAVYQGERSRRARFRLATAERYFDREREQWVERETVWLDVVCWRRLADHVAASVTKGEPVIVRGRLRVSTYESDQGQRQAIEVIATSVGHDLAMGDATFSRTARPAETPSPSPSRDPSGVGEVA